MLNKILGSTQETKCTVGYKMVAFVIISFWRSLSIFLWWIKTWAKVCWNGNKYKAHCTLSLEESNNLMRKKVTQHLKHLLWPKKHASYQEAWKENTNGWGLKEGKTKCSARFEEQYSRGSEQIISKQTAWKHVYVWWGHWRTCFDQRSRKWNFFLTQPITCILYI